MPEALPQAASAKRFPRASPNGAALILTSTIFPKSAFHELSKTLRIITVLDPCAKTIWLKSDLTDTSEKSHG